MGTDTYTYPSFIKVFIYANIYVAVCAASQVLMTERLFHIPFNFTSASYVLFIFLSTYVQYNMQRGYVMTQDHNHSERAQWVMKHRKIMLISNVACLLCLLFLCNNLSWTAIGIMVGAELISTLYYMPPFNLRRFGYVKPFLLGLVWMVSCGMIPLLENQLLNAEAGYYLCAQFCVISALSVLFDIKDSVTDYMNGVNTYANAFGVWPSRILAMALIVLSAVLFHFTALPAYIKWLNDGIMTLSLLFCVFTGERRSAFFYYLYVDGLMCLQGLGLSMALHVWLV